MSGGQAVRRMELRRFATLRECTAEWESAGPQAVHIWEPLDVDAPADARPYCCYLDTVIFYDRAWNEITRTTHRALTGLSPHLVHVGGIWYEIQHGRVERRGERWCMVWDAVKTTRHAIMMNSGFHAYRNPENRLLP